jgi:hypothetical protein
MDPVISLSIWLEQSHDQLMCFTSVHHGLCFSFSAFSEIHCSIQQISSDRAAKAKNNAPSDRLRFDILLEDATPLELFDRLVQGQKCTRQKELIAAS